MVYLLHAQFIPEDRLVELMADLFGVKLAAATIARMMRIADRSLTAVWDMQDVIM